MGKWNDLFQASKSANADRAVPFGGAMYPGSEEYFTIISRLVKGGFFVVPDLDTLADIPMGLLEKDMEVVVSAHNSLPRQKYYLASVPPQRISSISGYVLSDYWQPVIGAGNTQPGDDGDNGWTPVFGIENDGERCVLKVVNYIGGTGTKPTIDPAQSFVGPSGLTTKSNAVDIRGPKGLKGDAGPQSGFGLWEFGFLNSKAATQVIAPQANIVLWETNDINTGTTSKSFLVSGGFKCRHDTGTFDGIFILRLQKKIGGGDWEDMANCVCRPYIAGEDDGQAFLLEGSHGGVSPNTTVKFRVIYSLTTGGVSYRNQGYLRVFGFPFMQTF